MCIRDRSKSALGKYETDDYKDISPFAIATLANFYGVSTDYLLGLSENKNHPNAELQALHLSDDMVTLLSSGKINNRLLCELATHSNFQRLMVDMEIFIDRIADMRVDQMNLILEATRQTILGKYAPGENNLYVRTLELGQVQESDFFSHILHDDLDSILRDIREAHRKDKTTADPQPTLEDIKDKFQRDIQQGSSTETMIHVFCDKMQIPFEKISSEDFSAFLRILSLSKMIKKMCIRDRDCIWSDRCQARSPHTPQRMCRSDPCYILVPACGRNHHACETPHWPVSYTHLGGKPLAQDSGILQFRYPDRHDRNAQRNQIYLQSQLFWRAGLFIQPERRH